MGKASRRQRGSGSASSRASRPAPVPFERRPFEGLPGETDWVALREILPAATATVTVRPEHVPDGAPDEVVVATVLPMAWPGLHRADGTVLIGTQSGNASGDPSRDLAAQLLAATEADAGLRVDVLRLDGGMSANAVAVQALADAVDRPVEVSHQREATALGAGFLAGVAVGTWPDLAAAWTDVQDSGAEVPA